MSKTYIQNPDGTYTLKTNAPQCKQERVDMLSGRCQGAEGHTGDHWCYLENGTLGIQHGDDHPNNPRGGGWVLPSDSCYKSPKEMWSLHYDQVYTTELITDAETIARLDASVTAKGDILEHGDSMVSFGFSVPVDEGFEVYGLDEEVPKDG